VRTLSPLCSSREVGSRNSHDSSGPAKLLARVVARCRKRISDERGAILVFVAVSLVGIIGFSGLAIDLGRGYVTKIRLSRAVDAAAIEAASNIRLGRARAEESGRAVAALNGIVDGVDGISLSLSFATNVFGETTVTARASGSMTTTFSRILGQDALDLSTEAVAAVPPVDMIFVLDQSGSLDAQGVWDDLQTAANQFVAHFDDSLDQIGLVHYQIRAEDAFEIDGFFTTSITNAIDNMNSAGDTNTGEGLRLARKQMKSKVVRERSAKVVVFFTDGRPTAFRDEINGRDRVIAVPRNSSANIRGLFENPEALPMSQTATPDDCAEVPVCYGWTEATVREEARQRGLHWADKIRSEGVVIYTVGLGNPSATDPIETPDMGYLELLANVGGIVDGDQPRGRSYFAPSAAQLQDVFSQVARDLMVRLAK
jgi:Flp pilus assembly protein TadG